MNQQHAFITATVMVLPTMKPLLLLQEQESKEVILSAKLARVDVPKNSCQYGRQS